MMSSFCGVRNNQQQHFEIRICVMFGCGHLKILVLLLLVLPSTKNCVNKEIITIFFFFSMLQEKLNLENTLCFGSFLLFIVFYSPGITSRTLPPTSFFLSFSHFSRPLTLQVSNQLRRFLFYEFIIKIEHTYFSIQFNYSFSLSLSLFHMENNGIPPSNKLFHQVFLPLPL